MAQIDFSKAYRLYLETLIVAKSGGTVQVRTCLDEEYSLETLQTMAMAVRKCPLSFDEFKKRLEALNGAE